MYVSCEKVIISQFQGQKIVFRYKYTRTILPQSLNGIGIIWKVHYGQDCNVQILLLQNCTNKQRK